MSRSLFTAPSQSRLSNDSARRRLAVALAVFSAIGTVAGGIALTVFDDTPGVAFAAPARWPASTGLRRVPNRATLLVFAHPSCSCTDATIAGLARLERSATDIAFVVFRPMKNAEAGMKSLVARAAGLQGARFVWDEAGVEAKRFGAQTSGYVVLYGSDGKLLFHGGITGSRGHEGDNFGLSALRQSVETPEASGGSVSRTSQVFGCALVASRPKGKT
jgi:hypothetical protein